MGYLELRVYFNYPIIGIRNVTQNDLDLRFQKIPPEKVAINISQPPGETITFVEISLQVRLSVFKDRLDVFFPRGSLLQNIYSRNVTQD